MTVVVKFCPWNDVTPADESHDTAVRFEEKSGALHIYSESNDAIAVYARGDWRSAVVVAAQESAPRFELVTAGFTRTTVATDLYGGDEPAMELARKVAGRKVVGTGKDESDPDVAFLFAIVVNESPQGDVGAE